MTKYFAILLLAACAPEASPPDTISIDPDFSEAVAEVIRGTVDAWCSAVEWCPLETDNTSARGRFVRTEFTGRDSDRGIVAAYNTDWRIVIAPDGPLDWLWTIVAHEIGHWCTVPGRGGVQEDEHTIDGLLQAYPQEPILEIDYRAIRAWKAGCVN